MTMVGTFWIVLLRWVCLFFFKQKTAYEMRISDWSSDVCSSDLRCRVPAVAALPRSADLRAAEAWLGAFGPERPRYPPHCASPAGDPQAADRFRRVILAAATPQPADHFHARGWRRLTGEQSTWQPIPRHHKCLPPPSHHRN